MEGAGLARSYGCVENTYGLWRAKKLLESVSQTAWFIGQLVVCFLFVDVCGLLHVVV